MSNCTDEGSNNMKVVYIAGPYRANTVAGIRRNIEEARMVAEVVWQMGHCALCPHLNSALMDGIAPDSLFLDGGIELVKRCDAVVLVPGWDKSMGSHIEVAIARKHGIPVVTYPALLARGDLETAVKEVQEHESY